MLEKAVEKKFVKVIASLGYIALKLSMQGRYGTSGYPDREILFGLGLSYFIEFKKKGERPTAKQEIIHGTLREKGYRVSIHDTYEEAIQEFHSLRKSMGVGAYGPTCTGATLYGFAACGGVTPRSWGGKDGDHAARFRRAKEIEAHRPANRGRKTPHRRNVVAKRSRKVGTTNQLASRSRFDS